MQSILHTYRLRCHSFLLNIQVRNSELYECCLYLHGAVVHLLGLLIRLVWHQVGFDQVLIETVSKTSDRHVIWENQRKTTPEAHKPGLWGSLHLVTSLSDPEKTGCKCPPKRIGDGYKSDRSNHFIPDETGQVWMLLVVETTYANFTPP